MEDKKQSSYDSSAVALEQKHAAMLERLANRQQSRATAKPEPNSSGSTKSFLSQFSQSKLSIEAQISRIQTQPDLPKKTDLEAISLEISALEKLVAENSYLLPPYEVRNSLSAITYLRQTLDDASAAVAPKKKFAFKNKSSKKSAAPAPDQKNEVVSEPESSKINAGFGEVGFRDLSAAPGFRNKDKEVLVKEFKRGELDARNGEFTLSNLRDCEVRLKGCLRAVFVDNVVKCKVYVGVVMGSVLIEGAEGCLFVLASHQIRIHKAKNCDLYLRVRSRPIIEDSNGVRFAPYCLSYRGMEEDLAEANLDEETGNWANVDDFRWLRALQSPNWSVLPEDERVGMVNISNDD
ncbi:tubulin-folding cofactor C-like [Salvia miltiorrhiza]|uniref:tubulin-folding cofactor C-like n=1 Tax=Salvia miltiorrhiza TaxID=226208 RepID=UPI0025ABC8C4|nr:tubulin-folding cofactor C-like [Salvia miltiorrhiza]XP_057770200.1 tubulin-folding cofactor C-like [Salvia miltiorrhiza]XP_057770201.1 tubulin-folding cofactor C-like [Salvia miltiorrhiza]XP_057770202.1 tubulin-folding cofactor C-like [Salvia miltiorrhiza]XP_057770203.1 tubulin-folding cofactor C-like [Salvia miltiorrhiza]XP_057770204.1 tubulin-folding cofactor C-like [Salvia miltiorrhiza]